MSHIISIATHFLDLPPSCAVTWPTNPSFAIIGTYNLERNDEEQPIPPDPVTEPPAQMTQQRSGSLVLINFTSTSINIVDTFPQPSAVLDLRFYPTSPHLLAAASSTGTVSLFTLHQPRAGQDALPVLDLISILCIAPPSVLVTALAFETNRHPVTEDPPASPSTAVIGATLSTGAIILTHVPIPPPSTPSPSPTSTLVKPHQPRTHDANTHTLEAWTLAILDPPHDSRNSPPLPSARLLQVLSGGDDSALRSATLYFPPPSDNITTPPDLTWTDTRTHAAGVTAILPLTHFHPSASPPPTIIATGSYDSHLRVLSLPTTTSSGAPRARPAVLASADLGGGVWRLDLLRAPQPPAHRPPHEQPSADAHLEWLLLASVMHAGAAIVRVSRAPARPGEGDAVADVGAGEDEGGRDRWSVATLARFAEHESMCYAACARGGGGAGGGRGGAWDVVSTSFYDRRVCLWRFDEGGVAGGQEGGGSGGQ